MIHIDCSKEALNFCKYDLAEDEIFVIDNLFPWWFVEHLDQVILHGFGSVSYTHLTLPTKA